jgi:hypothetical protein
MFEERPSSSWTGLHPIVQLTGPCCPSIRTPFGNADMKMASTIQWRPAPFGHVTTSHVV